MALLPPGVGVDRVEAMVKELRTAAALEVGTSADPLPSRQPASSGWSDSSREGALDVAAASACLLRRRLVSFSAVLHAACSKGASACLQASVYLVRSGKGNVRRVKAHSVHAPARRLARTTISLGPDDGIAFGLRAVRYAICDHCLATLWEAMFVLTRAPGSDVIICQVTLSLAALALPGYIQTARFIKLLGVHACPGLSALYEAMSPPLQGD